MRIRTLMKSDWLRMAMLAVVYFALAKVGISQTLAGATGTLFWPPSGIALAALLLFGRRLWPGIFIGAFGATLGAGLPLWAVTGIALGNTAAALLGAFFLSRRIRFHNHLDSVRDILYLLIFGAVISTALSAANGSLWLELLDGKFEWRDYRVTYLFWWMGDALGVVLFAPAVIALFRRNTLDWTPALRNQALLLFSILILLCFLVFTGLGKNQLEYQLQAFTILPVIIWAALGFNLLITNIALIVTYAFSLFSLIAGVGRFVNVTQQDAVDVWLYNFIVGVAGQCVAMMHEQRSRAYKRLEQSERNFKRAQRVVNMGSWQMDLGKNVLIFSDEVYEIFGLTNDGHPLHQQDLLDCVHPDDYNLIKAAWLGVARGEAYDIDHRIVVDGQIKWQVKWVRQTVEIDFNRAGRPITAFGTVRDITRRKLTEERLRLAAKVLTQPPDFRRRLQLRVVGPWRCHSQVVT